MAFNFFFTCSHKNTLKFISYAGFIFLGQIPNLLLLLAESLRNKMLTSLFLFLLLHTFFLKMSAGKGPARSIFSAYKAVSGNFF